MLNDPVVIVSAARTPMGAFQGELKDFAAPQLGAAAIRAAVERAGIRPGQIQEAIMGCVLPAGQGQAPARQAALGSGLPVSTGTTTVNKMCGSGMKAAMLAHDLLAAGSNDIMVAGGMESMTNAPYLLPKARSGYRMGHQQVLDHMFYDGLEDAYDKGRLMGSFAEDCAAKYQFTREAQDDFAIQSLKRAQQANREGWFAWEITPIAVKAGKEEKFIEIDEQPFKANLDKIPTLKPAFRKDGTVTAANSSSISDVAAMAKLFELTGWSAKSVDLYEVNEAFAVVTMAAMKEHGLPHDKVNVHGGACALGHPIGASGARILVTLIGALRKYALKRGMASLCIGGGEATAMAIELV